MQKTTKFAHNFNSVFSKFFNFLPFSVLKLNVDLVKKLYDNSDQRQYRTKNQIRNKDKFGANFEIRPKFFCQLA